MSKIMVCRLCGSVPLVVTHRDRNGNPAPLEEDGYGIVCRKEGVRGGLGHYIEVVASEPQEAIAEWNRLNA